MQSVPDMKTITQHLQQALVITMVCHCFSTSGKTFGTLCMLDFSSPDRASQHCSLLTLFKHIEYDLQMLQQQQDLLKREQQADKNLYNYSMRCQIG